MVGGLEGAPCVERDDEEDLWAVVPCGAVVAHLWCEGKCVCVCMRQCVDPLTPKRWAFALKTDFYKTISVQCQFLAHPF